LQDEVQRRYGSRPSLRKCTELKGYLVLTYLLTKVKLHCALHLYAVHAVVYIDSLVYA